MSGLETAIRNALEKSDRANPQIRARIYQSARQALESGLAKQGVTDDQVAAAQRQRLELKIREIEGEERSRLEAPAPQVQPPAPEVQHVDSPRPPMQSPAPHPAATGDAPLLGGALRDEGRGAAQAPAASDPASLDTLRAERDAPEARAVSIHAPAIDRPAPPVAEEKGGRRRGRKAADLDVPPERAAKPRRRRGFLSVLTAWLVFFAAIGAVAWWAYSSGLVQQSLEQALEAAENSSFNQSSGQGLGAQVGFSEDWIEVFDGSNAAAVQVSAPAVMEPVTTAGGPAIRLASAAGDASGDITVEVPAEILSELAGRTSTIALTVRSAADTAVQFAVRCDFGSLGSCSRHRFTAHREKADALFRVTFDAGAASSSGRLVLSTGISGESNPILLYAVRVLPAQ